MGVSRCSPIGPHGLLLDDAQQLDLHVQRQVRDFVEKQRAAFGGLEQPSLSDTAPVKLPRLCPKNSLSMSSEESRRS